MSRNKIRWNSILLFLFLISFGGFGAHCRIVQPRVNGTENLVGRGGESAIKENPEKVTTEEAENDPRDATGILSEHKPNENGTTEGQSQPNENETIEGQSQPNEIPTKFDLTGEKEGKPFDTENPNEQTEERDLGMFIQTKGKNDTIDEETKNLEKEQKREEIAEGERTPIMNGQPSAIESGSGFIRLFPFLKGTNSESIEQFRSLLRDQSLSKGELEKKRQEWAERQPLEIKTSYLDWKKRLDKSKKKTIGRIEKKLTIFIKGVKSVYKKIKAIILDQKISRSMECEQICSAIDSAPQGMREFFLQIKLIKFCLTQAKMAKPGENNQISQNSMIKFDEQMNQDSTNPKMVGHENAQMAQPVLDEEKILKFPVGNDNQAPENSPNTPVTAEGNDQKGKIDDKSSMASVEEVGRDDPSKKDNPKWPNLDLETSTWKPDPVPDPKKNPDESSSSSSSSSSESVENEVKEAINKETPADEGKGEKKVEKSDQEKQEKKKAKKEGETSSSSSSSDSSSGSSSSSSSSSSDEDEKKDGKEKNKVKKSSKEDKGKEDEEETDSSSSENDKKSKKKDKKEENSKMAKKEKRAHGKKRKVESSSSSSSDTDTGNEANSVEKGKKEDESSPITTSDDAEKEKKHHEKKRKRDGKKGHEGEENGKKEAKEETGPPSDADDEEPVKVHKKHKKTEEASAADE